MSTFCCGRRWVAVEEGAAEERAEERAEEGKRKLEAVVARCGCVDKTLSRKGAHVELKSVDSCKMQGSHAVV